MATFDAEGLTDIKFAEDSYETLEVHFDDLYYEIKAASLYAYFSACNKSDKVEYNANPRKKVIDYIKDNKCVAHEKTNIQQKLREKKEN